MPRKLELTFQRGAEGRVGRWKKFYRGKAYYLGGGRGKSDLGSYREATPTLNSAATPPSSSATPPSSIAEKHYIATSKNALDEALNYLRLEYRIEEIESLKRDASRAS